MPGPITDSPRPVAIHDPARGEALAPTGHFEGRTAEVAPPQPRAQGVLERAWSAINSFVKSVAALFSRAAPAPAQPRAAETGAAGAAGAAAGGGPATLNVSARGRLEGADAQRFAQVATNVLRRNQAPNEHGICADAATDWQRNTLIIGGETSSGDTNRSIELLRQLTGGNADLLMRISQFANQNNSAGIAIGEMSGQFGNQNASGNTLMPGERQQTCRCRIDAQPDGGFQIRHELEYSHLVAVSDSSTSEIHPCDPGQSGMNYAFSLRIAPDGAVSVSEPLSYDVRIRSAN
jgi:hypothetical protein